MAETAPSASRKWVSEQVAAYSKRLPDYESYASVLRAVLQRHRERDPERKTSPSLVAWSELPDHVKELARSAAREIPKLLSEVGLSIRKREGRGEDSR